MNKKLITKQVLERLERKHPVTFTCSVETWPERQNLGAFQVKLGGLNAPVEFDPSADAEFLLSEFKKMFAEYGLVSKEAESDLPKTDFEISMNTFRWWKTNSSNPSFVDWLSKSIGDEVETVPFVRTSFKEELENLITKHSATGPGGLQSAFVADSIMAYLDQMSKILHKHQTNTIC